MDDLDDILEGEYIPGDFEVDRSELTCRIVQQLETQHPMHGALGRVYQRVGGEERLVRYADENFGAFLKMMFAATPSVAPTNAIQGDINITINNNLISTALDG